MVIDANSWYYMVLQPQPWTNLQGHRNADSLGRDDLPDTVRTAEITYVVATWPAKHTVF